jgi:hypothetical protein
MSSILIYFNRETKSNMAAFLIKTFICYKYITVGGNSTKFSPMMHLTTLEHHENNIWPWLYFQGQRASCNSNIYLHQVKIVLWGPHFQFIHLTKMLLNFRDWWPWHTLQGHRAYWCSGVNGRFHASIEINLRYVEIAHDVCISLAPPLDSHFHLRTRSSLSLAHPGFGFEEWGA